MSDLESYRRALGQQPADDTRYGPEYYKSHCGPIPYERNSHWLNFFGGIADEIIRRLRPRTVFDAGCGWGFLVESFRDRGIEARGVDISQYAIGKVRRDIQAYCSVASVSESINGWYDLITCIEVLEHISENDARQAVCRMSLVTDNILFSSTPSDFDEPTHVNVHSTIYWLRIFAEFQFYPDLLFDASFVAPHAFLIRRRAESTPEDVLLLFSETLRNRIDRAAFLARHGRIEQLEGEVKALQVRLEETSQHLTRVREENEEMRRLIEAFSKERDSWKQRVANHVELEQELYRYQQRLARAEEGLQTAQHSALLLDQAMAQLAISREEEVRWKAQVEARELARRDAAQLAGELQLRLEDSKRQVCRIEFILEEWIEHSAELSSALSLVANQKEALRADLNSIYTSPGWRFILRYRDWRSNHGHGGWAKKSLELVALWLLRRLDLAGPPVASIAAPAAADIVAMSSVSIPTPSENGDDYEIWIQENEPNNTQLELQRRMSACFSFRPKISIIVPVYKVPVSILRDTIESVLAQTYDNWELCVSVPDSDNPDARSYLEEVAEQEPRLRLRVLVANEGIAGNSNQALTMATGEYLALLDHDDTLATFALFEAVQLLNEDRTIDFIYSDKDQITEDGTHRLKALFKPQWSPELMLNANYLTHLCVMRTDHVREVGGWRKETDGAQDWDLFLRVIKSCRHVRHIPKVLYHWRQTRTSVASGGIQAKPYAIQGQIRTVEDHCRAIGLNCRVTNTPQAGLRIAWPARQGEKVSIIFLSTSPGNETLHRAARLAEQTKHPDFEILVPMAGVASPTLPVQRIATPLDANLLDRIELAVSAASGQTLVFFDEHLTPAGPDWLREMTGPLQLADVGIVGARLIDAHTHSLRHCGMVFTREGRFEYVYAGESESIFGHCGGAGWYRNWTAVSGACLAIRRDIWGKVGGMAGDLLYSRLDVHLCLKLRLQTDWRISYNPWACLLQSQEAALEAPFGDEARPAVDCLHTYFPDGDPYFSPNLDCRDGKVTCRIGLQHSRGTRQADYSAESRALVHIYDSAPAQVERSRRTTSGPASGRLESITWFLPDFHNSFYGGIHTILRFADTFHRNHRVRNHFCVIGHAPESRVRHQVAAAFPELAAASDFFIRQEHARANELPPTDAAICSLWSTAYAALEFEKARRKFYFIQDDESLFYPAGSTSALVEATYRFGFHGICNTISLLDRYIARGGQGEYFDPSIDATVFHDRGRKPSDGEPPHVLFCYSRPGHPRNCFELLASALRILKQRMGERLLIITAGEDWDLPAFGLEGVVQNLGLLGYHATGALYRMCDAGLVMMMTRHPSYLPLELMACGSLVITNRNADTAWLLQDGENCLLAEPTPGSLAERVEEGLTNISIRRRLRANGRDLVQRSYSNWDESIEKIYRYMVNIC